MATRFNHQRPVQSIRRDSLKIRKELGTDTVSNFVNPGNTLPGTPQNGIFRPISIEVCQGNIRKQLQTLLPFPDWKFIEQQHVVSHGQAVGAAFGKDKVLTLASHMWQGHHPVPFLSTPSSMFITLHEVGHARDEKRLMEADPQSNKRSEAGQVPELYAQYWEIPANVVDNFEELVVQGESNANDFALNAIGEWRADGIDLEPGQTMESLKKEADAYLKIYQNILLRLRKGIQPHQMLPE